MKFTYDPAKNIANIAKHGEALSNAALLEWDLILHTVDTRHDYGEVRLIGYAPINQRLYCVVFTIRGQQTHIISLRKTNDRETSNYERNFK
jgi:uncharacterized DUF497 family protein